MSTRVLVTGAGGFIGNQLVRYLQNLGYWVRGADLQLPEWRATTADEFLVTDLRERANCLLACHGVDEVYSLAADMGGIGYLHAYHAQIARNNHLISTLMLDAAHAMGVQRYFFSSSACVYPLFLQEQTDVVGLREEDAYPAQPEDAYGWEKLVTERNCRHYTDDYGLVTRVARFHNVYGPEGTFRGGREKAPAALCRKVAQAKRLGDHYIEIWGDGQQTRSFLFIDDCCQGIYRIMQSECADPVNLGTERLIAINALASLVAHLANWPVDLVHVAGTQGVRGRNSDNTKLRRVTGWSPGVPLEEGMAHTYDWIEQQLALDGVK